jgi:predicted DNA-binding transcriptional regulator AlpA
MNTDYISQKAAAAKYGISGRMLARLREEGGGPEYIRLGRRRVVYAAAALAAWVAANTHPNRAAELARETAGAGE